MEEYYPYTVIPEKVKSTINNQIPLPKLPKLLPVPDKVKRGYLGTVIFVSALIAFILVNVIPAFKNVFAVYALLFILLIALVAMIFEFVQYGKLKKHYQKELKYFKERQESYRAVQREMVKIVKDNKNPEKVNAFRQEKIHTFFNRGYNVINAVHNEYSPAKKRFKLFLEAYFPDEILDDIKVVHRQKKINYVPDFVIQFKEPKINIAIEIEEPYSLSYVPENIQKDYEAKDRLRQRFADELAWIVIILSEEQAVLHPTECCRFIEDSMSEILHDIKRNENFAEIKPIKKQKILSGKERAKLKAGKYREIYLKNAGLMDTSKEDEKDKLLNDAHKYGDFMKQKNMVLESENKKIKAIDHDADDKQEIKTSQKLNDVKNDTKSVIKTPDNSEKVNQLSDKKVDAIDNNSSKNIKKNNLEKNEKVSSVNKKTEHKITDTNTENTTKKDYKSVEELIRRRKLDIQKKLNKQNADEKTKTEASSTLKEPVVKNENKTKSENLEVKIVKGSSTDNDKAQVEITKIDNKKRSSDKPITDSKSEDKSTVKTSIDSKDSKALKEEYHKQLESAVFDKEWDTLIDLCNKVIKEFPKWDWAYYRRSTALGHKKEFEKVIADCNEAVKINNKFAEAYYNRATANFFLNKYSEAVKDYEKAIFLDYVKVEQVHFNKGLALLKLNKLDDAYKEFLEAKRLGCQKSEAILKQLKDNV